MLISLQINSTENVLARLFHEIKVQTINNHKEQLEECLKVKESVLEKRINCEMNMVNNNSN